MIQGISSIIHRGIHFYSERFLQLIVVEVYYTNDSSFLFAFKIDTSAFSYEFCGYCLQSSADFVFSERQ